MPVRLDVLDPAEAEALLSAILTQDQPRAVDGAGELCAELADPAVTALGVREGGRLVAAVRLRALGEGRVALGRRSRPGA